MIIYSRWSCVCVCVRIYYSVRVFEIVCRWIFAIPLKTLTLVTVEALAARGPPKIHHLSHISAATTPTRRQSATQQRGENPLNGCIHYGADHRFVLMLREFCVFACVVRGRSSLFGREYMIVVEWPRLWLLLLLWCGSSLLEATDFMLLHLRLWCLSQRGEQQTQHHTVKYV